MKQYRVREGDVTALDTKTQLTTVGSDIAPGALMVPQGAKFITGVRIAVIQNMAAATGFSGFIRLEGPGMINGPQTLAAVAGGNSVATGGNFVNYPVEYRVNFPVSEANEVQVFAEMAGTDVGALGYVVGLEFSDAANEGADEHKTLTVEGDVASVDTRTALLSQGSVAAPSMIVPAGFTKIDKIGIAATAEGLANGKQTWFIRLGGNSVLGGEQILPISASGTIAPQAGSDAAPQCMTAVVYEKCDITVSPSDTISIWAEGAGDDTGTGHVVATLVFSK